MRFRPEAQTAAIFDRMEATLREAGSSPSWVVKLQTFHRNLDDFPPHLSACTRAFSPPLPPSTAVEGPLSHPAEGLIKLIAVADSSLPEPVEMEDVPRPLGPYSQAVVAAPFVFLAGVLASDFRTEWRRRRGSTPPFHTSVRPSRPRPLWCSTRSPGCWRRAAPLSSRWSSCGPSSAAVPTPGHAPGPGRVTRRRIAGGHPHRHGQPDGAGLPPRRRRHRPRRMTLGRRPT